jgi:hypothetical protein
MRNILKSWLICNIAVCLIAPLFVISISTYADCEAPPVLSQETIFFYDTKLGVYNVNLTSTLSAIKDNKTDSGNPYYQKTWYGDCPGGLSGSAGSCIEFTVYPNQTNFYPGDIMQAIKNANDGEPNRGEVRVLTDEDETHYVYTVDHEKTFCGPYPL